MKIKLLSIKKFAKKISIIYKINSNIKSILLKKNLKTLKNKYELRAKISNFVYNEQLAIDKFNLHLNKLGANRYPVSMGKLRIFWLGANESQDKSGLLQALQRLGMVKVFENIDGKYGIWYGNERVGFEDIRRTNDESLLYQIYEMHNAGGVDLLIGQMWADLISKEALSKVRDMGIPVINISMDDRLPNQWASFKGVRMGSSGLSPSVDMVLTTSSETCLWYGVENTAAIFWPLASDPDFFATVENQVRDIDVLFIGNCYGIRSEIVMYLKSNGINVSCYGHGWPNGAVDATKNSYLSKRARIILGVGTVGHCKDVYTLKLRDFDALMTGALYITHRNQDLCKIFKEGVEIEFYDDVIELVEKIKYYNINSFEREQIGFAGRVRAMQCHSWNKRFTNTFVKLGLLSNF